MELRSVEELMELLHTCGGTPNAPGGSGEPVDPHDRALRTAALLRRSHPADKELQVAGLVHGIGRLLRPVGAARHTDHGADAIRPLLGERVSRLVRLHVATRRYLAAVSPGRVSFAWGASALTRQGGPMTPEEAAAFERDPLAGDAVTLHQAAEAAERAGVNAGVLEDWRTVLELVAARHARLGAVD
jgi:predicted HD phosphohydrolase